MDELHLITQHRILLSFRLDEWEYYDPHQDEWFTLQLTPPPPNDTAWDAFAAGNQLLMYSRQLNMIGLQDCRRYNTGTNSWLPGVQMNRPRSLFGSASYDDGAIVAGGYDARGATLKSAELYMDGQWTPLPNMNKRRKECSGVFMDGKFYVIGGTNELDMVLTCGEEFDLNTHVWSEIPRMALGLQRQNGAPPLVAVVNNELYAAVFYPRKELKKYDMDSGGWETIDGSLPDSINSTHGFRVGFRACGDRLLLIGGTRGGEEIEIYSFRPNHWWPHWNCIATLAPRPSLRSCVVTLN